MAASEMVNLLVKRMKQKCVLVWVLFSLHSVLRHPEAPHNT